MLGVFYIWPGLGVYGQGEEYSVAKAKSILWPRLGVYYGQGLGVFYGQGLGIL